MAASEPDWAEVDVRLLICIVGLVGNLLAIFVIIALQDFMKAVTHWYVLQLAIADSIFLLTLPFKVHEVIHDAWKFSTGMCSVKETVLFLNYYASITFLVIMSIDRYIAVCHGFSDRLQKFRTQTAAFVITAVVWSVCLLLCIPVMLYSHKAGVHPYCKCRYEFPTPLISARQNCINEGFKTEKGMQMCLSVMKPEYIEGRCQIFRLADVPLQPLGGGSSGTNPTMPGGGGAFIPDLSIFGFNKTSVVGIIPNMSAPMPGINGIGSSTTNTTSGRSRPVMRARSQNAAVTGSSCDYNAEGEGWKAFLIFNFVVMFIVPFIVLVFCYTAIVIKIRETRAPRSGYSASEPTTITGEGEGRRTKSAAASAANAERNRITVMCAVLVVLFLVCWLPFHAVHMAKIAGMNLPPRWCRLLPLVSTLLGYMNSALNPYMYNFLGTKFGKRMKKAVGKVSYSTRGNKIEMGSSNKGYQSHSSQVGSTTAITKVVT